MKKIILFILMSPAFLISAQDWKPVNTADKYYYTHGNVPYATLWADSVKVINNDSVFFMNRVLKKVKNANLSVFVNGYYLEDQPQFLLSKLVCSANGDVSMQDDNNKKYLIRTKANLHETWVFDSTNQDTAEVVLQMADTVFGFSDSVKMIRLPGDDTICLSKNYGILRFPLFDSVNQSAELAGIEGRNIGVMIPKFSDIYNYNTGDVFCYQHYYNGYWSDATTYKKIVINSKGVNGDTISYISDYKSKMLVNGHYSLPDDTICTHITDSALRYVNNPSDFLNKYNNQILGNGVSGLNYKPLIILYDTAFNVMTKSYVNNPYCKSWFADTVVETTNLTNCSNQCHSAVYGKNVGSIYWYIYIYNGGYHNVTENEQLVGCIINGVTYGTIYNDSVFLSVPKLSSKQSLYKVYPNPAITSVIIEAPLWAKESTLTICDMEGRQLIEQPLLKTRTIVDLTHLTAGVYLVKITGERTVELQKIIKE